MVWSELEEWRAHPCKNISKDSSQGLPSHSLQNVYGEGGWCLDLMTLSDMMSDLKHDRKDLLIFKGFEWYYNYDYSLQTHLSCCPVYTPHHFFEYSSNVSWIWPWSLLGLCDKCTLLAHGLDFRSDLHNQSLFAVGRHAPYPAWVPNFAICCLVDGQAWGKLHLGWLDPHFVKSL